MSENLDLPYQHILVLGLAKSGTAAAKVLLDNGKSVRINDRAAEYDDSNVRELQKLGAEVILGSHPLSVLENVELVIKNPGIPYENPLLQEAMKRKIPIITEIELAGRMAEGPIIAITGSNGKTTTTTLITNILSASNQSVKLAGNIGIVASEVARDMREEDTLVMELSSFQLLGIQTFKPKISVILNIVEAHIDYHKTFENYKNAKFNIFKNQTEDDYFVFNADDEQILQGMNQSKAKKVPFSLSKELNDGAWLKEDTIYFKNEAIIHRQEIALVGNHNMENILASICVAKLSGASNEAIKQVLTTFTGVKHRLQFVDNIKERLFYNDSKATNVLATSKALSAFDQPTILLAGGLDRGNPFDELIPYLQNVRAMVVFGETASKLKKLAEKSNIETIIHVEDVKEAAESAYAISKPGDIILLSPACASWDQYKTFEERGDMFIQAVHTMK